LCFEVEGELSPLNPNKNDGVQGKETSWKNIGLIMTASLLLSVGAIMSFYKKEASTTLRGKYNADHLPAMGLVPDGTTCWIDKKDGDFNFKTIGKARPNGGGIDVVWIDKSVNYFNYETVGKARPNGGGIDIVWIDKTVNYFNYVTVGKARPNGGGIDTIWIDEKDGNWNFKTVGKTRPNGGGINTIWIDKKDGDFNFKTVGKIRPNSASDDCTSLEVAAVAGYLLLLDDAS